MNYQIFDHNLKIHVDQYIKETGQRPGEGVNEAMEEEKERL